VKASARSAHYLRAAGYAQRDPPPVAIDSQTVARHAPRPDIEED
jgi:hypothetical protein